MSGKKMGPRDLAAAVKKLMRSASESRLRSQCWRQDLEVREIQGEIPVLGHWMSVILISHPAIKLIFRAHFNGVEARKLAAGPYKKGANEVTLSQAQDFANEFCNLVAGLIKRSFEKQNIVMGISLPLGTRGFDEVYFPGEDGTRMFTDRWSIGGGDASLSCSASIEVQEAGRFPALDLDALLDLDDEGGIEFL